MSSMSNQHEPSTIQNKIIQLEVVSEEKHQGDIVDIDEVGRSLFDHLRNSGYTATAAHTGKKGGEPLFDVLLQGSQFLHDNKDVLLALFESVTLILQCLFIARDRRAEIEKTRRAPLIFTLQVDGRPLTIETADVKDAVKLIEQFQKLYPDEAKKLATQHTIKIEARVPKKRRRGSH